MKAFTTTGIEDPLVAPVEVAEPVAAPSEAVVAVRAFGLNRSDVNRAQRLGAGWRPGIDAAGVVELAASDGSGPAVGTQVVMHAPGGGLAAERVAVPAQGLVPLPHTVEPTEGAALGLAGIVALRLVRAAGSLAGRTMLMTGATGGIGQFVVQLAIAAGAEVTVITPAHRPSDHLSSLGARVIHDLAEAPGPFDLVLETVGGTLGSQAIAAVAAQGLVLWYGEASGEPVQLDFFSFLGAHQSFSLRHFVVTDAPGDDTADLAELVDLVASGRLSPVLGRVADWTETPELLAALRDRDIHGKAILTIG